jgi:beta-lactamase class A
MWTRRQVAAGLGKGLGAGFAAAAFGAAIVAPKRAAALAQSLQNELTAIEGRIGGRLGVAVLDTASDTASQARIDHRGNERFLLCSTFKVLAVSAVLKRVEAGREHLDRRFVIKRADLVAYSPVLKDRIGDTMALADLCAAAMTESDNTAANLILRSIGGPRGLNAYARTIGDATTRLDNNEPMLNHAKPLGLAPNDTTTPLAMVKDLQAIVLGNALAAPSRDRLKAWLLACRTGDKRLRAGLPEGWQCGDKTGSGEGSTNDIAILWPPQRPPVIVAAYLSQASASYEDRETALADVGRAVVAALAAPT